MKISRAPKSLTVMTSGVLIAFVTACYRLFVQDGLLDGDSIFALTLITLTLSAIFAAGTFLWRIVVAIRTSEGSHAPLLSAVGWALPVVFALGCGFVTERQLTVRLILGASMALASVPVIVGLERASSKLPSTLRRAPATLLGLICVLGALGLYAFADLDPDDYYAGLHQLRDVVEGSDRPDIVVIGVDGLDWDLTNRLIETGELPTLARFAQQGRLAPLHTLSPTSSPFLWNTIYTGFTPAVHRLRPYGYRLSHDLVLRRLPSRWPDLISPVLWLTGAAHRGWPDAFWDVMRETGYETAILGSWEPHFPVPKDGLAFLGAGAGRYGWNIPDPRTRRSNLSQERYAWLPRQIRRSALQLNLSFEEIPAEEWRSVIGPDLDLDEFLDAEYIDTEDSRSVRLAQLRRSYAYDRLRIELGLLTQRYLEPPYLQFVYIRGIDWVQHEFAHQLRGPAPPGEPENVVERYYRRTDRWLEELIAAHGNDTIFLIVSDHGLDLEIIDEDHPFRTGEHPYAPHGVFGMLGPGIAAGKIDSVHILDVSPSVLALAGIPILSSTEGRPLSEITGYPLMVTDWHSLEPLFLSRGNPDWTTPHVDEVLRSLGYIR